MGKELICICCPIGCHLKVDIENKTVSGNSCKRGESYGISEFTNPVRVLTSTVKIENGEIAMLPVRTKEAIPKELTFKAMGILYKVKVKAPIKVGDTIVKNILDTNIDVIATRDIDVKQV